MSVYDRIAGVLGRHPDDLIRRLAEANGRLAECRRQAAVIKAELAGLRAQFWGYDSSNFTHERRIELAQIIEDRRNEAVKRGEKITESALDSHARSHISYKNWIGEQHRRRKDLHSLEAKLAQVNADAEAARGDQKLAEQELRILEEAIRFARSEPQAGA